MTHGVIANRVLSSVGPAAPMLAWAALLQPRLACFELADQAVKTIDQKSKVAGGGRIEFISDDEMQLPVTHGEPNEAFAGWILLRG